MTTTRQPTDRDHAKRLRWARARSRHVYRDESRMPPARPGSARDEPYRLRQRRC